MVNYSKVIKLSTKNFKEEYEKKKKDSRPGLCTGLWNVANLIKGKSIYKRKCLRVPLLIAASLLSSDNRLYLTC